MAIRIMRTTGRMAQAAREACERCGLADCLYVPGCGPLAARVVIVGEAPGDVEAARGVPFVGPAGRLLDQILAEVGIDREECYVTNACLCRPRTPEGAHRNPTDDEIACCRDRLLDEVAGRAPDLVILCGATPLKAVLGKGKISDENGLVQWCEDVKAHVMPVFHPSAALHKPGYYIDIVKAFRKAAQVLHNPSSVRVGAPGVERFILETRDDVDALCARLAEFTRVTIDEEHGSQGQLLCLGLSYHPGTAVVLPRHLCEDRYCLTRLDEVLARMQVVGQNIKSDLKTLWRHGMPRLTTGGDLLLAHYLYSGMPGDHDLESILVELLNVPPYKHMVARHVKCMEECPPALLHEYNGYDAAYTHLAFLDIEQRLTPEERAFLEGVLYPASDALARMEYVGVLVDVARCAEVEATLSTQIAAAKTQMYAAAGGEFNPNYWKDVCNVLYGVLGLPLAPRGKMSSDEENLTRLSETTDSLVPGLVLEYRKLSKLYSTYVQKLPSLLDSANRLHTTYNLNTTRTGRLSSKEPNLQNIPHGSTIHQLYVPSLGCVMVQGDLSQAEVRVLALFSKDKVLLDAVEGADVHRSMAAAVFKKQPEDVTSVERTSAKRATFGIMYGITARGLARSVGCSEPEAQGIIDRFFAALPQVREWIESTKREAMRTGVVRTPFGRRRVLNFGAENTEVILRQAVNTPIQSTASDICLAGLVRHDRRLLDDPGRRLLLTVHDSISVEVPVGTHDQACAELKQDMEFMWDGVHFRADVSFGPSWGALEDWEVTGS